MEYNFNKTQTQLTEKYLNSLRKEVRDELIEYLESVQFLQNLIRKDRPYAKDLEKDEFGRIKVNVVNPHILEDMDYFRQPALHYQQYKVYTKIHPNAHPSSSYYRFWKEEAKRCREGLVREDGEWIPGPYYFYLNYSPILKTEVKKGGKAGDRMQGFPDVYDGDYCFYHYEDQAREEGEHVGMLKKRGAGFSYKAGSGLTRIFVLGDSEKHKENVAAFAIANEKEYLIKDGILNKFIINTNWCAEHTPWSRIKLKESFNEMQWVMGYKNKEGITKGTNNSIIGVTTQGDPDKARGKRGPWIFWEEWGKNPHLLKSWEVARQSIEEGSISFGVMVGGGTGGTEGADFRGAEELFYRPKGYGIRALNNVYDKNTSGKAICAFFFPAYMNRLNCYDHNGNSDVIAALVEILERRIDVKYGSSEINALVQHKAEMPITPQEAIMRREGNIFPIVDLKEVLADAAIDIEKFIAPHYIGNLKYGTSGLVEWDMLQLHPVIRDYPAKDLLDRAGNIEIFEQPVRLESGVPHGRYIAGIDPIDSDEGLYTNSLGSIFIFDMWTDRIVAEYTGRPPKATDFYEHTLRLLRYYNAQANYENNIKGFFAYADRYNMLHYLCETPQILKDMDLIRGITFGNAAKGTHASKPINSWARKLQADWMISDAYNPIQETAEYDEHGNEVEKPRKLNLQTIRSIGYLKEAIAWNADDNFDRVSAMGMVMILREDRLKYLDRKQHNIITERFNDKWFSRIGGFNPRSSKKKKFSWKDSLRYSTIEKNYEKTE